MKLLIGNRLEKGENGAALVTALFLITILTVLGMMVLNTTSVEIKMAANQKQSNQVFYAAEGGLERGLSILVEDMEEDAGAGGPWGNLNFPAAGGNVSAAYVNGSTGFDEDVRSIQMYRDGDTTSGVRKLTFANGGTTMGNSTYELYLYSPSNSEVYLLSYASGSIGTAAVEYHLDTEDLSPYNNAVFTGTGINPGEHGHHDDHSTMNIAGSIYSQGQVTLGTDSLVVNTYADSGCDSTLTDMLPTVTSLNTKVRVKGGALSLNDNAAVGTPNSNGSISEIQADAGFNQGSATNYVDAVGTGTPNIPMPGILDGLDADFPGVSSDPTYSGISNDVDRSMAIYNDLVRGLNGFAPGGTYADPNATVTSKGVVLDGDLTGIIEGGAGCSADVLDSHCEATGHREDGDIEIQQCTPSFSCKDSLGNGIEWDATNHELIITGVVMMGKKLDIKNVDFTVNYTSMGGFIDSAGATVTPADQNEQAALVVAVKDIKIKSSFVPANGAYLQGGDNTNAIGFIGGKEIELEADEHHGTGDAIVTGMFYTPGEIELEHGTQVAGTLIGGEFKAEDNPSVCQVPAMKNFLPRYMPGANSLLAFKSREWSRKF